MDSVERQNKAVAMRLAGAAPDVIARTLGYPSEDEARNDILAALQRRAAEGEELPIEVSRMTEVDRLDRLQAILWPRLTSADEKVALSAAATIHRIIESRCDLLDLKPKGRGKLPVIYEP